MVSYSQKNTEGRIENVERVLELANHYFATMMVKIGLSKNHHWMLNLGDNFYKEHNICMVSPHCLLVAREKKPAIIIQ